MARKNEVAKTTADGTSVALFEGLQPADRERYLDAAERRGTYEKGGSGVNFLGFSGKSGRWAYGRDKEDVEGALALYDFRALFEGWVYWQGSAVKAKERWSSYDDEAEVAYADLPTMPPAQNDRDGWKPLLGTTFKLQLEDGSWADAVYETNAQSAMNALRALENEVTARMADAREERVVPVVELGVEGFTAQGNDNYKPAYAVQAWLTPEQANALLTTDASLDDLVSAPQEMEPEPKPAPRAGRRRRAA